MATTSKAGGDIGEFRPGKRIVTPRARLIVPETATVKLYTLTPDPERFERPYLSHVREGIKEKLGREVPIGIGLGFAILSENAQNPKGYLNVTMWQMKSKTTPPTPHSHLFVFDSGRFPDSLEDRGVKPYCMYEQEIAGFEARALNQYCHSPDGAGMFQWETTLASGELPLPRQYQGKD